MCDFGNKFVMQKSCVMKSVGFGAVILTLSGFVCKLLGAFFRVPLVNLLGVDGVGVFQLVMSIYAFALVLVSGGTTSALSKLVSRARANGKNAEIESYLKIALLWALGLGFVVGVLFALLSKALVSMQGVGNFENFLLFALLLPFGAVLAVFRGYFQGFGNMLPTAISQVIEQTVKFTAGLLFAMLFEKHFSGFGVFGALFGITISEFISVIFLLICFLKKNCEKCGKVDNFSKKFCEYGKISWFLTISALVVPCVNAFDSLVLISRLELSGLDKETSLSLFGLQSGVCGTLLNFPLVFSVAVASAMLPNVTVLVEKSAVNGQIIAKYLKILMFFVLPATFGLVAISKSLIPILFSDLSEKFVETAFWLLLFGGFATVLTAFMHFLFVLLQAYNEFRFISLISVVGGAVKMCITFFLSSVWAVNIFAVVFGNFALTFLVVIFSLFRLKQHISFEIPYSEIFPVLFGTLSMFLVAFLFVQQNPFSNVINVLVATILGGLTYLVFSSFAFVKFFKQKN